MPYESVLIGPGLQGFLQGLSLCWLFPFPLRSSPACDYALQLSRPEFDEMWELFAATFGEPFPDDAVKLFISGLTEQMPGLLTHTFDTLRRSVVNEGLLRGRIKRACLDFLQSGEFITSLTFVRSFPQS